MNPGLEEQGGETARTLITSLKDSPLTLSLVLFNLIFIGVVAYGSFKEREWRTEIFDHMSQQQAKYADMLYNCTPNRPQEH